MWREMASSPLAATCARAARHIVRELTPLELARRTMIARAIGQHGDSRRARGLPEDEVVEPALCATRSPDELVVTLRRAGGSSVGTGSACGATRIDELVAGSGGGDACWCTIGAAAACGTGTGAARGADAGCEVGAAAVTARTGAGARCGEGMGADACAGAGAGACCWADAGAVVLHAAGAGACAPGPCGCMAPFANGAPSAGALCGEGVWEPGISAYGLAIGEGA